MYLSAAGSPQCLHDELFFKNETMGGQHESLQDCGCWRRLRRHGDGGAVCVVFDHGTADLEHGDRSSEGALRWNFLLPGAAANMAATAFMWNRIVLLFWWIAVCWLAQRTTCPGCLSDPQPRRPHRGAAVAGAAGVSGAGLCYAAYSDPTALFLESYPNAGKSLPLQRLRLCAGTARPAGHMGAFRALRRQRLAAI